jgi:hypothetical protein
VVDVHRLEDRIADLLWPLDHVIHFAGDDDERDSLGIRSALTGVPMGAHATAGELLVKL